MKSFRAILFAATFWCAFHRTVIACPSCYGAADSPMTAGMNTAILVMLGITGGVLMIISAAFFILWRRAKRATAAISDTIFVDEDGVLKTKNEKGVVEWNSF